MDLSHNCSLHGGMSEVCEIDDSDTDAKLYLSSIVQGGPKKYHVVVS